RRHTRFSRDWSSDVCSSDLGTHCHRVVPLAIVCFARVGCGVAPWIDSAVSPTSCFFPLGFGWQVTSCPLAVILCLFPINVDDRRSEERRVGKECRLWSVQSA